MPTATAQVLSPDTLNIPGAKRIRTEPKQENTVRMKSPTGAIVRSALFPGWGQFYTRQYVKGGLIFCLESGLILSAIIEDKRAEDVYQTDYEQYLERIDRRNGFIWWTIGVMVYSMIDAYVDAHLFNFDEEEVAIGIEPSRSSNEIRLTVRVSIPDFE